MIKLSEVFDKLPKEKLGMKESLFRIEVNGQFYERLLLCRKNRSGLYFYIQEDGTISAPYYIPDQEVEWPIEEEKEIVECNKSLDECHARGMFPNCFMSGCKDCPTYVSQLLSSFGEEVVFQEEKEKILYPVLFKFCSNRDQRAMDYHESEEKAQEWANGTEGLTEIEKWNPEGYETIPPTKYNVWGE